MGFWDEVKKIFKNFKLVEIKNEVHLHGDINIPFKGDTIHYSVPESARVRIASSGVTPEMEKAYEVKVHEAVKAKESVLVGLPEKERNKAIAETSVASAVEVLTTTTTTTEPPEKYSGIGEEASIATIRSTGPPKKPWGSDEGETA